MNNIYITTFQNADNYGAALQAFALHRFLNTKGYNTSFINYDNKRITKGYKFIRFDNYRLFIKNMIFISDFIARKRNFKKFRKNYVRKNSVNNIDYPFKDGDILITGSDQVWNPSLTGGYDNTYFLKTSNPNTNRISYAASCGDVKEIEKTKDDFISAIKTINHISVREQSLKVFIENNTSIKTELTLDPTLLLDKEEWEKQVSEKRIIKEKYIFVYTVGNDNKLFVNNVNKLAEHLNCKIVYFDQSDFNNRYLCKKVKYYKGGPKEFLNLLYYSEYVLTTSFHALAFSVIFNKKFYVVLSDKIDRLLSLLDIAGLKNRIIYDESDIIKLLNDPIDWESANARINAKRLDSQNWLINSVESKKENTYE